MEIEYDGKEGVTNVTRYNVRLNGYSGFVYKWIGEFYKLDLQLNVKGVPHWDVWYGEINPCANKKELEEEILRLIEEFKKQMEILNVFLREGEE